MRQTETAYIEQIQHLTSITGVNAAALEVVEEALAVFPSSARLWCLHGDMIQMQEDESEYELAAALASYRRAVEVDASCAEAHESIGYFHNVFEDNLKSAECAFRTAIQMGAGASSYVGLARVLAQDGRKQESLDVLASCPDQADRKIKEMRDDIENGVWSKDK